MDNNAKVFFGFLAGLAAGAGLYALSKTEKGQEFIEDLKHKAEDWRHEMEELARKGKKMAEDLEKKLKTESPGQPSTDV